MEGVDAAGWGMLAGGSFGKRKEGERSWKEEGKENGSGKRKEGGTELAGEREGDVRLMTPTDMAAPVPTRAGNVFRFAALRTPPCPSGTSPGFKENLKSSSFFKMLNRSAKLQHRALASRGMEVDLQLRKH